ncbi:MAG TPA: sugar phosphate isomerase/epimerase family protein [Verrucomicrobiae bacterium]|nr:sugar phosphate isomerase/epimerase family protein [Verrucomicrobiae bacterium]
MNSPLHHVVRPGIIHFMAFPATMKGEGPILETCRQILADDFFEVIEITWIKDPAVRAKVKSMLAGAGVEVKHGGQPRLLTQKLDLNSADETARRRAIDEIKRAVDDAAEMGIKDVGLLSGSDVAPAQRPAAMDRLENSLVELCRYAGGFGCNIVLEVFDRDIDKKCLIGPADTAREISERVKRSCPNFGLMVDLSHIPLLGESPAQALQPVREHILHIHIGNAYFKDRKDPAWGDQHPRFGYPGSANDVPEIVEFLRELFKIGYLRADGSRRGAVSFEIKPVGDEDPTVMIANSKRKLLEAWAKLVI